MIKAILTDIEGTTSSIRFVHDVLFPYAAKHMESFVTEHHAVSDVSEQLDDVASLANIDRQNLSGLIEQLRSWMSEDKKITPLKTLQGMIWTEGYHKSDFTGHVYADVIPCLKRWQTEGVPVYVYSSGSVRAQKLLFSHTEYGDLTGFFAGYFDTQVGGKKEASSYSSIAKSIGMSASAVLFLSDIEAELSAADEAGMNTCWLVRDDAMPNKPAFHVARSFADLSA